MSAHNISANHLPTGNILSSNMHSGSKLQMSKSEERNLKSQ